MWFKTIFAVTALSLSVAADGPWGGRKGTEVYNPDNQIPQNSVVDSVACRGQDKLDYLEIVYRWIGPGGAQKFRTISYGSSEAPGKNVVYRTKQSNDQIEALGLYLCDKGWASGLVCGLRFVFESGASMGCGLDQTSGRAEPPLQWGGLLLWPFYRRPFNSFFIEHTNNVITKIGWTSKK